MAASLTNAGSTDRLLGICIWDMYLGDLGYLGHLGYAKVRGRVSEHLWGSVVAIAVWSDALVGAETFPVVGVEVALGGVGGDVRGEGGGVQGVGGRRRGGVRGRVDAVGGQRGSYISSPPVHLI